MKNTFLLISLLLSFLNLAHAQGAAASANTAPEIGFSIIKTSKVSVVERLLKPDGRLFTEIDTNFSAFLIKHRNDYLLFDTGLGSQIDEQYRQDMTLWQRPFFKYDKPVVSARAQLDTAGYAPIKHVVISHSHWDHAGGVLDFPEARISVPAKELDIIRHPTVGAGGTWASQVASKSINWNIIEFKPVPYKGYASSLDLFQDGTVVLVPMPGHTPGSIGLFVTVDSGKCYFFIGDVSWKVDALKAGAPKFWAASLIVDTNAEQTQASAEKVRDLMKMDPNIVVVPAHDGEVQNSLGYFPGWVR